MSSTNHNLAYRPLVAGVGIYNPIVNEVGTLGLIATSDGTDRWIVSCFHVLARNPPAGASVAFASGEPILQGSAHDGVVAKTDAAHVDASLDCAAAMIEPGIASLRAIAGLGDLNPAPATLAVGTRLLKAGAETGVTEGVIVGIDREKVIIGSPPGFPAEYMVAGKGDSGSLWVTRQTLQPVAVHLGVRSTDGIAVAAAAVTVLAALRLRLA